MKVCRICNEEKTLERFGKHKHASGGLDSRCKKCISKDKALRTKLLKEYEHTRPEVCECCEKKHKKTLCLDHDHETGEFNGWLCDDCNVGIGRLGDTIDGLMKAVKYKEMILKRKIVITF
jgi:hypothetical protein